MVCRRYGTTIRQTCFALFKEVLKQWKLTPYVKIRETDFNIKFPNGSEIIFTGLDDETKLLSLTDISTIFVEEVYEVPQDIFEQLNLRMRGSAKEQQILAAFNPISKASWLYHFCVEEPPKSFYFSETTYKDNPYLDPEYVKSLEELAIRNPAKARIFKDGEWGVPMEGLVFTNWEIKEFDELELSKTMQRRAGCDEGFTDPSAIVDTLYDEANKTIYIYNQFYKTGQTLDDIYNAMIDMHLTHTKIYTDSASPRLIDFLKRKGINAVPCIKGQGSVEARISFWQNLHIVVHPRCTDVIRELENFSYIKDKEGNWTDKTTHEFSHSLDAGMYAYSDIYTKGKLKTINKSVLGL